MTVVCYIAVIMASGTMETKPVLGTVDATLKNMLVVDFGNSFVRHGLNRNKHVQWVEADKCMVVKP